MPAAATWGATLAVTVGGIDVSCETISVDLVRGRLRLWDPMEAATCSLVVNAGPDGVAHTVGAIGFNVTVNVIYGSINRRLFTGKVQLRQLESNVNGTFLNLDCVDGMEILSRVNKVAALTDIEVGDGDNIDERIDRWLDEADWMAGRDLTSSSATAPAILIDGNVLDNIKRSALADGGDFYIAGDGAATFRPYEWRTTVTAVAAVFSDRLAHDWVPYSGASLRDDLDEVQNDVYGIRRAQDDVDEPEPQHVFNASSVSTYGPRGDDLRDLELDDDLQVAGRVAKVVAAAAQSSPRFDPVVVQPAFRPSTMWPRVLGIDWGSLVVTNRRWESGAVTSLYGHVIGERWRLTADDATITYRISGTGTWDATMAPRPPIGLRCDPITHKLCIPEGYPCDTTSDVVVRDVDGAIIDTYPPGSLCFCEDGGGVPCPDDGGSVCLVNDFGETCVPITDPRIEAILWVDVLEPGPDLIERIDGDVDLPHGIGFETTRLNVIDPGDYDAIDANAGGGLITAGDSSTVAAVSLTGGWTVQLYLYLVDLPSADQTDVLLDLGQSVYIVLTTVYDDTAPYPWTLEAQVWDDDDVVHLSGPLAILTVDEWHLIKVIWDGTSEEIQVFVDGIEEVAATSFPYVPRDPTALWSVSLPHDCSIGEVLAWAKAIVPAPGVLTYDEEVLQDDPKAYWPLDAIETAAISSYDIEVLAHSPVAYWPLGGIITV